MKELLLDASGWKTQDDVYDSFFRVVGAPTWHGKNLDAPSDSIATGQINKIEVPYRLVVKNSGDLGTAPKTMLENFVKLIRQLAADGCGVEIRIE